MKNCAVGIDLGGTKIAMGAVDDEGHIRELLRYETATRGGYEAVLEQMVEGIGRLRDRCGAPVCGIGVGVAGQVNPVNGSVVYAPNLEWRDSPLKADLEKASGIPTVVTNDVRAALWGEWLFGAGRGGADLICIFVGTGIGGGIVSAGRVLEGCSNTAGEIGHMTVDLDGPLCNCGNRGCLEALAGGWAIARDARERVKADPLSGKFVLKLAGKKVENIAAKTIVQAFHAGDPLASEIMDGAANALIAGVSALVNALNPCRIILGGGIIDGMPELVQRVENGVRSRSLDAAISRLTVCASSLGGKAGIIGAATLAMKNIEGSQ
jgi:glucokinase